MFLDLIWDLIQKAHKYICSSAEICISASVLCDSFENLMLFDMGFDPNGSWASLFMSSCFCWNRTKIVESHELWVCLE